MSILQVLTIGYFTIMLPVLLVFYAACAAAGKADRILRPNMAPNIDETTALALQARGVTIRRS